MIMRSTKRGSVEPEPGTGPREQRILLCAQRRLHDWTQLPSCIQAQLNQIWAGD
jgi:hypothetical protein